MNSVVAALTTVAALATAASALGATINVDETINRTSGNIATTPGVGGGEFMANGSEFSGAYSPLAKYGNAFATFCLERNEPILLPHTYDYVKNTGSVEGGMNAQNPDPISRGTAYLYTLFALGTLPGYDYNVAADRPLDAGYLQDAIWYLEQEFLNDAVPLGRVPANSFLGLVTAQFGSLANARLDNNDSVNYPVYALNLYEDNKLAQDIIVYCPPSTPDGGATVFFLGAGMTLIGLARRRVA